MYETKAAITAACGLPLSIIIVGVGNADFTKMDELDGNGDQQFSDRDIVQFVPFRKFLPTLGLTQNTARSTESALARAVLEEVPAQLTSYMRSKGIPPRPPLVAPYPEQDGSRPAPSKGLLNEPAPLPPHAAQQQRSQHESSSTHPASNHSYDRIKKSSSRQTVDTQSSRRTARTQSSRRKKLSAQRTSRTQSSVRSTSRTQSSSRRKKTFRI